MTLCFSLAVLKILFIFNFCHFNYNMSWYRSVWGHLVWDPLCFLYLDICFLIQVWEFFSYNFFKYIFDPLFSFFSFWNTYYVQIGMFYTTPQSLILLSFFIWLSVCCFDWIISIILSSRSLILSSALFILLFIAFSSAFMSANEFSNFLGSFLQFLVPFYSNLHFCQQFFLIPSVFSLPSFFNIFIGV